MGKIQKEYDNKCRIFLRDGYVFLLKRKVHIRFMYVLILCVFVNGTVVAQA